VHWDPGGDTARVLVAQSGIPAQVAQIRSDANNYYTLGNKEAIQILVTESDPPSKGGIVPFLSAVDKYPTWLETAVPS